MKHFIIKLTKNIFLTTGLTITLLACVAILFGGSCIFVKTIFEVLVANICFHIALLFTCKFESKYYIFDNIIDITTIIIITLLFGLRFDWFSSTPPWILVPMVIIIYTIGSILQVIRIKDDIHFINEKLKQRKNNKNI